MPLIEKWGTTLAVRIPEALARSLGVREGDHLTLRADGDGIAVSRKELPIDDSFSAAFRNARGTVDPEAELEP